MDVAWRRPLGSGYSGVAVAKDLAVTLFSDGSHDVVAAFDASDGQERWRYKLDDTYRGHDGSQDGPLSTPAIADGRIFALAPRGKLVALDASNGKPLWSSDLVGEHGAVKPHYGFTTSPLVAGGVLIVQAGAKEAMVIGLDPHSGKRMWAAGDDTVNYQSPILRREENADQVLAAGDEKLLCLEPHSGKVLWEYAHEGKGERGAPCMIPLVLDPTRVFLKHLDDGSRTIAISRRDGGAAIQSLWDTSSIGKTYAPAIASNGFLYGYSNRSLSCVDANTGKVAWRSREPGDGFIGLWGQRLVVVTKEGGVHLAKANPNSYEELTSLKVFPDLCWSPPTIADGSVFVRSLGELARITIRPGLAPARATRDSSEELAGTAFGKLLDQVRGAKDKPALIDPFLRSVPQFPIIESDGRVIFVYRGPAKDVELGGDVTGFGAMHRMIRVDDTDLFYCVERLERDARATYGFLCDYKAVSDPLNPRKLVNKWYDDELELAFDKPGHELSWFAMPDWKPAPHIAPVEESRRGRSERQTFRSNALDADVEIEVYLPNGYEKAEALPVVYVHDGPLARGQLMLPNTLDNLAGRRVAPVIAVFIDHQPPFFGDPEKYARMAAKELPAFIESKYRAIAQPEARAHIAFGVAGYAAMVTVLADPDAARKLGVQSPFMTGASELRRYLSDPSRPPLTIYFGWCKYDLRNSLEGWSLVRAGREIDGFFREHGYHPLGGESPDGSDPEGWRNRTDDMLEALFPLKGN
jgi:outer membrane protein assembly factor BamB